MTLHFARANKPVQLRLTKWLGPAPHPLRREREHAKLLAASEYAGYSQQTSAALVGLTAKRPLPVGIWNLIQLPHGGEMIIPTYAPARPRVLFGNIPHRALRRESHCLRFRADLPGEQKIAVRAAAITGRMGYVCRQGREQTLVVRNFSVSPSGEYIDVPKDDPEDLGYAVDAVNVHSALGEFCELEYHAPAIGLNSRQLAGEDLSQVWAFRGPRKVIRQLAALLLGAESTL